MANIRKQFNFRNGVQVDDDNLIVNSLGLVGIGTTIPTEVLDVRGTAKVVGLVTANQIYTPSLTAENISITNLTLEDSIIGGGVSIRNGVINASSSAGVVTYYGDGANLLNLPTSQWIDVNVGLGFTSIYAQGFVGVATNDPRYAFQIGGTNDLGAFTNGVGISSNGDIVATGIVTGAKFVGIGSDLTLLNANNISSGTISNDRIPVLLNSKLPSNINVSGIITATGGFIGTVGGTVYGSVVGIVTGNLDGTASFAQFLTGDPDISVTDITADDIDATTVTTDGLTVTGSSSQQVVNASKLEVGTSGTTFTVVSSGDGRIGIGSTTPTSDIQILKSSNAAIEVISPESSIILEEEVSGITLSSGGGVIRYGNSDKTFDLLNYGSGNFNYYLHSGAVGIETGKFGWIYGQTLTELMSLTYDGNLGIGKTDPENTLHVVGTSTVTGSAWIGGDLSIVGNLNVQSIQLPLLVSGSNIFTISGVSTFNDLTVQNTAQFSSIGIGTTNPIENIDAQLSTALFSQIGLGLTAPRASLDVIGQSLFDSVGIGTTTTGGNGLVVAESAVILQENLVETNASTIIIDDKSSVGIGTTLSKCSVDFSEAGLNVSSGEYRYMLPPRLTTAERVGLTTIAGAFIFNIDTNTFQGYTGIAWTDFH